MYDIVNSVITDRRDHDNNVDDDGLQSVMGARRIF